MHTLREQFFDGNEAKGNFQSFGCPSYTITKHIINHMEIGEETIVLLGKQCQQISQVIANESQNLTGIRF
jgi:hypothetical protein